MIPGIAHQGSHHFGVPVLAVAAGARHLPRSARRGDIYLHPVARAAWVGMFATAMNLLPIGQLDGGHILYSFFPRAPSYGQQGALPPDAAAGHLLARAGSSGRSFCWWLGRRHPVIYDSTELGDARRKLGWLALVIFILCFTYQPFADGGL